MSAPVTDPPARSRAQRRRDAEHRLAHGVDPGVATAAADGTPGTGARSRAREGRWTV
jgi:hypothetical protein